MKNSSESFIGGTSLGVVATVHFLYPYRLGRPDARQLPPSIINSTDVEAGFPNSCHASAVACLYLSIFVEKAAMAPAAPLTGRGSGSPVNVNVVKRVIVPCTGHSANKSVNTTISLASNKICTV